MPLVHPECQARDFEFIVSNILTASPRVLEVGTELPMILRLANAKHFALLTRDPDSTLRTDWTLGQRRSIVICHRQFGMQRAMTPIRQRVSDFEVGLHTLYFVYIIRSGI